MYTDTETKLCMVVCVYSICATAQMLLLCATAHKMWLCATAHKMWLCATAQKRMLCGADHGEMCVCGGCCALYTCVVVVKRCQKEILRDAALEVYTVYVLLVVLCATAHKVT